jgi:RimJ/RimL family protein N-acetyltransferase
MHQKIIISEDIELTRMYDEDAESIARHIHDKTIYKNTLKVPYPYLLEDAHQFLQHVKQFERDFEKQKDWAIRIHGELCGGIGLLFNFGVNSHRSEIGYWLTKSWRGRGIMQQVILKFSEFCFSVYGLVRLEAHVFLHNPASQQVLNRTGFEKEGLIKAAYIKDGEILDAMLFAKIAQGKTEYRSK